MYYTINQIDEEACFISKQKAVDYLVRNYYTEIIDFKDDIEDLIEERDYEDLTTKQQLFLDL